MARLDASASVKARLISDDVPADRNQINVVRLEPRAQTSFRALRLLERLAYGNIQRARRPAFPSQTMIACARYDKWWLMNILRKMLGTGRSASLARNIVANIFGRGWIMFMSFAFVPIYIKLLGIEAYGVIGLFATLMIVFSVLDFGLSVTLNRELSRMIVIESEHENMPDLIRTLEVVYWGIGLCIGAIIILGAPYLARHWLHPAAIPVQTLENTIRLIGVTAALQWPTGLYGGGIAGLQKFVRSNMIDILVSTLRAVGGLGAILVFPRSLEAYFIWQAIATVIGVLLMRHLIWSSLPIRTHTPRINLAVLRNLWRFSAGMASIGMLGIISGQGDKIVLSASVSLAFYAKYLVANALAVASGLAASMILPTLLPQLSEAVATATPDQIARMFHRFCQLVTLAIAPVAMTVCAFSFEVLNFWTRDVTIAQPAAPIASILCLGVTCATLFQVPFLLQMANGETRSTLIANIISAVLTMPLVYLLIKALGSAGAAWAIMLLAAAQLLVVAPLIQRRLLPGNSIRWLIEDVGLPLAVAAATAFALRSALPSVMNPMTGFAAAMAAGGVTLLATALSLSSIRSMAMAFLARRRAGSFSARPWQQGGTER